KRREEKRREEKRREEKRREEKRREEKRREEKRREEKRREEKRREEKRREEKRREEKRREKRMNECIPPKTYFFTIFLYKDSNFSVVLESASFPKIWFPTKISCFTVPSVVRTIVLKYPSVED